MVYSDVLVVDHVREGGRRARFRTTCRILIPALLLLSKWTRYEQSTRSQHLHVLAKHLHCPSGIDAFVDDLDSIHICARRGPAKTTSLEYVLREREVSRQEISPPYKLSNIV